MFQEDSFYNSPIEALVAPVWRHIEYQTEYFVTLQLRLQ